MTFGTLFSAVLFSSWMANAAATHLRRHTALPNDASDPAAKSLTHSADTGGSCSVFKCNKNRGEVGCIDSRCICDKGYYADGFGRCLRQTPGKLLPATYKLRFKYYPEHYLYMKSMRNHVDYTTGDPGPQGHWRIIVNNDLSLVFFTERWWTDYLLTMKNHWFYGSQCAGRCAWYVHIFDLFMKMFSDWTACAEWSDETPAQNAFKSLLYANHSLDGKVDAIQLQHIKTGRYLYPSFFKVKGSRYKSSDQILLIDPPLPSLSDLKALVW